MLDRKGVVYRGRTEGMDQWKSAHAVETKKRTLEEAINLDNKILTMLNIFIAKLE